MRSIDQVKEEIFGKGLFSSAVRSDAWLADLAQHATPEAETLRDYCLAVQMLLKGDARAALEEFERLRAWYATHGEQADVARLHIVCCEAYGYTNEADDALRHADAALRIYEDLDDGAGVAHALHVKAAQLQIMGENMQAVAVVEQGRTIAEERGLTTRVASLLTIAGMAWEDVGEYDKALQCQREALDNYERAGDRAGAAHVEGDIGRVLTLAGNLRSALEHCYRAMATYEDLDEPVKLAETLSLIGTVYGNGGDYPQALDFLHRALSLFEQAGIHHGIASTLGYIAIAYLRAGDLEHGIAHGNRALAMHEEWNDKRGIAFTLATLGTAHADAGDLDTALDALDRALAVDLEIDHQRGIDVVSGSLARVYIMTKQYDKAEAMLASLAGRSITDPTLQLDHLTSQAQLAEVRGDLHAASTAFHKALDMAVHHGLRSQEAELHRLLRDLARQQGDFEAYVTHNDAFTRISEDVRGKEAIQKLAMMEAQRTMQAERSERDKERALLYGALPQEIADRMVRGESVSGDHYDHAAVLFLDVVSFTTHSAMMPPAEVVQLLESIFMSFDDLCLQNKVIKVKTIGDSYMCFKGDASSLENATALANLALAMLDTSFTWPSGEPLTYRIGMHIGPATAGVIGTQRLQYDVWGDTVNVASRMESTSEPGRIQVSEAFAQGLSAVEENQGEFGPWTLDLRGQTEIKGKGLMQTYWLDRRQ